MKLNKKSGFTLIELLVVITIIGILATGAVAVFTTQLQWARDSTRISDIKVVESALHQLFSDNWQYPEFTNSWAFKNEIKPFVSKDLKDPKQGISVCFENDTTKGKCNWFYNSADDSYGLPLGMFKLWVKFEKETNYKQKAKAGWKDWDGWNINNMYEVYAGTGGSGVTLTTGNEVY